MKKIILMLMFILGTFAFSEITTSEVQSFSRQRHKFMFQIKKIGFVLKYQEQMKQSVENSIILSM